MKEFFPALDAKAPTPRLGAIFSRVSATRRFSGFQEKKEAKNDLSQISQDWVGK
jgi:hypothetical protein